MNTRENNDIPTTINSAGIKKRRKKKIVLRIGHPSIRKSVQLFGLRTRVSQAATVRVHTKKYLWAERRGGRRREFGRSSRPREALDMIEGEGMEREVVVVVLSSDTSFSHPKINLFLMS